MSADKVALPFIGSGVKQDLHVLYNKFLVTGSERIRDFAEVFKEMRFETVLHYRLNPSEHVEFAEYLLSNAALYLGTFNEVHAERSRTERIFGIYTCYALYSLQPTDHVCQIPITQVQFRELLEFQKLLLAEKLLEPLAALKNLMLKKAFRLTIFQSTYDPATHKRYLAEEEMPEFSQQSEEPFSRVNTVMSHQTFGELMYMHNAYIEAKKKLNLTEISMVEKVNPKEEIEKRLVKHRLELERTMEKLADGESVQVLDEGGETAGSSRSALRSKAYTAGMVHTRQRRYLDPNMEENFKIKTFGEIAQECLDESQQPGPSTKPPPKRRRRPTIQVSAPIPTDQEVAEQIIRDEYAARTKPEETDHAEIVGGKKNRQGTSNVAKIRAPPKAKTKKRGVVEVESAAATVDQAEVPSSAISPESKRKVRKIETKPKISDDWANKLHAFSGQLEAADKQLKKLTNRIKIETPDPE